MCIKYYFINVVENLFMEPTPCNCKCPLFQIIFKTNPDFQYHIQSHMLLKKLSDIDLKNRWMYGYHISHNCSNDIVQTLKITPMWVMDEEITRIYSIDYSSIKLSSLNTENNKHPQLVN